MHAVIGQVRIKPGHEDETRAMIASHGIAMVQGMSGSSGGYWSRSTDDADLIQHSFWLFDSEENARRAQATFNSLRDMPDAPATFISVDVRGHRTGVATHTSPRREHWRVQPFSIEMYPARPPDWR